MLATMTHALDCLHLFLYSLYHLISQGISVYLSPRCWELCFANVARAHSTLTFLYIKNTMYELLRFFLLMY